MPPPPRSSPALLLGHEHRRVLEWHALRAYPAEACGLLIGEQDARSWKVHGLRVAANLACARNRFVLDPGDHVRIDNEARAAGLTILGVWHTHPDQSALPSEADRRGAWEGTCTLIVETRAQGLGEVRAWRLAQASFVEQPVVASAQPMPD